VFKPAKSGRPSQLERLLKGQVSGEVRDRFARLSSHLEASSPPPSSSAATAAGVNRASPPNIGDVPNRDAEGG